MPPPTLMVALNKGTASAQVYKLLGGTTLDPAQDGSNIAVTSTSPTTSDQWNNPLAEAFGKRFFIHRDGIHERDEGGDGNWGLVHDFMSDPGGPFWSGLHVLFPNGNPVLAAFHGTVAGSGNIYMVQTSDGVNWSETIVQPSSFAFLQSGRSVVFGDSLWWTFWDQTRVVLAYDLRLGTATSYTAANFTGINTTRTGPRDFLVHQDRLYLLAQTNDANPWRIYRLDGVAWTNLGSISATAASTLSRGVLISDGNDIVAFIGTNSTPEAIQVTTPGGTPGFNDVSGLVLSGFPAGVRGWQKFLDVTDPGSPVWYLWTNAGDSNSGSYDCYQYAGVGSALVSVGSGLAVTSFTMPNIGDGGSDRIPAKPVPRPQFDGSPQEVLGGRKRFFRLHGTSLADVVMQQAHNVDQEAPAAISTLASGSIQLEDPIDVTGLVGNAGETTLEGLTPAAGDAYVLTELDGDRTLNPGGLTDLIPGDIVQYDGANWTLAKQVVNVEKRLLAYWKFDGVATDRTANGRDLTLVGAVPFVAGLFGQAADFPGVNGNYYRFDHDPALDLGTTNVRIFTVSAWVNIDALTTTHYIVSKTNTINSAGWWLVVNSSGQAAFDSAGGPTLLSAASAISAGAGWQHIVATSDGNDMRLYVDGVEVDTGTFATNSAHIGFGFVGERNGGVGNLDGQIDELAIWDRYFSPSEVTALYNAGAGRELGYPDLGTHATLNSTTALIAPYTDGIDDNKTVSFAGASLTGQVLNTPMNTTSQIMVTADEGASLWSYIHNASADGLMPGDRHTVMLDPI